MTRMARGGAGGAEGGRARLLELARLDACHARRHAGRQPPRRMGGDRPHHRRDGRARCRHLPGRPGHRQRRAPSRLPRAAAPGGARHQAADHVRRAGDQAGRRSDTRGTTRPNTSTTRSPPAAACSARARRARSTRSSRSSPTCRSTCCRPGSRSARCRSTSRRGGCAIPRCGARWSRPRRR